MVFCSRRRKHACDLIQYVRREAVDTYKAVQLMENCELRDIVLRVCWNRESMVGHFICLPFRNL